ncbi:MAG TPA: beta-propeller fold lactonase family protein [Stellaceae bacterium]|nr:beta-propeller fold lactonase family protein [Stellaceae bacterium]
MTTLYAAVGPSLRWYGVDIQAASLERRGAATLPANIQYAWPHASRQFLYVASSDSGGGGGNGRDAAGTRHFLHAFQLAADGTPAPRGVALTLPARPIHISTDVGSRYLLAAFSNPAGLRVYRIHDDGTLGGEVEQATPVRPRIFPHQIKVAPDGRLVVLVTRGNDASGDRPEDPGGLQVFRFQDGQLTETGVVAPNGGYGFGPRHLDFHPTRPWVYLAMERQNTLETFGIVGGTLSPQALHRTGTLAGVAGPGQRPSAIHVHPDGRSVYVANRAFGTVADAGRRVFAGGENTLAVFRITPETGEPIPVQHAETHGVHCRTFALSPDGRLLVAAHVAPMPTRDGEVPAGLSVFRILENGHLDFVRRHPVDVGAANLFWVGMI